MLRTQQAGFQAILTVAGMVCGPAWAQSDEPAVEPDFLRGPSVREPETQDRNSLVERTYDGELEPIDAPVAEAALEFLELDPETRTKVEAVMSDRAAAWDAIVRAELDTLNKLQTLRALEGRERMMLMREVLGVLKPIRDRGAYAAEIAAVLPDGQRVEYEAIVKEYEDAVRAQRTADRNQRGAGMEGMDPPEETEQPRRQRARQRDGGAMAGFGSLRPELQRSLERTVQSKVNAFESLIAALDLSPEQESTIRGIVAASGTNSLKNGDNQDPEARAARRKIFQEIMTELTPEQRRKAMEHRRESGPDNESR